MFYNIFFLEGHYFLALQYINIYIYTYKDIWEIDTCLKLFRGPDRHFEILSALAAQLLPDLLHLPPVGGDNSYLCSFHLDMNRDYKRKRDRER